MREARAKERRETDRFTEQRVSLIFNRTGREETENVGEVLFELERGPKEPATDLGAEMRRKRETASEMGKFEKRGRRETISVEKKRPL